MGSTQVLYSSMISTVHSFPWRFLFQESRCAIVGCLLAASLWSLGLWIFEPRWRAFQVESMKVIQMRSITNIIDINGNLNAYIYTFHRTIWQVSYKWKCCPEEEEFWWRGVELYCSWAPSQLPESWQSWFFAMFDMFVFSFAFATYCYHIQPKQDMSIEYKYINILTSLYIYIYTYLLTYTYIYICRLYRYVYLWNSLGSLISFRYVTT